jgi:aldehyde:ferredoxin oxidoreductase
MATPGFGGKILLVDLSKGTGEEAITRLDSAKYEKFGGGYGMGTAMFWDYCVAPGEWDMKDAFDPRNMVSLMTGPVSGTGVPGGARTSVSGGSPQCYPIQWFGHSNFGGMFSTMLRMAGWDGVSVIGRAENPVYINIVDDKVTIEDARALWGLNAWESQEEIYKRCGVRFGEEWWRLESGNYSLQRPQIVTIGAAGEKMTRVASLTHAGGSGAGTGGFGGVFGSKNLKAVAVLGTGGIKIADPKGLRDTREWWNTTWNRRPGAGGRAGDSCCIGCGPIRYCHNRDEAYGKDSDGCAEATLYSLPEFPSIGMNSIENMRGRDICQQYTLNGMECCFQGPMSFDTSHNPDFPIQPRIPAYAALGWYFKKMYDMGVIGPGTKFDTAPIPMDKYGTREFLEIYAYAVANRVGIGNLLAEGTDRFCEALGRTDDFNVLCRRTPWGYCDHWSMSGVEWAYSNLFDSRDVNNHNGLSFSRQRDITNEEYLDIMAQRTGAPGADRYWFDYSWEGDQAFKTGIYSRSKAECVSWHHLYWLFYKESIGFCDWAYLALFNAQHPQKFGYTPEAEPRWLNAITGKNQTFMDGIETGRRIFNLLRAIYALQGRHKSMEKFNGYYYRPGASYCGYSNTHPVYNGKEWDVTNTRELYFSEKGVETFKEHMYDVQGWNRESGYPTRKTLEDMDLKYVADYLQSKGKLG